LERNNDGMMDDKNGDDVTREVRRSWRSERGRDRSGRDWL